MNYRLLTLLLWPVFALYTLHIAIRDKSRRYFMQRLGFKYPQQKKRTLWIHCASVGEVNTYQPLHQRLLEKFPESQFVITTNTVTGARTVKRHNNERTRHVYLPIESSFAIKRFLNALQPERCLIMETEIWPLLYRHCQQQCIPLDIINARLSHRSLNARPWIKTLYRQALAQVEHILCKNPQQLENFLSLGALAQQLEVAGNLKFARNESTPAPQPIDLNERPYCLAASTHNDEELQLARIWPEVVSAVNTNHLLVIAPRHPNRSKQIQKQLAQLKLNVAVRSLQQTVTAQTQVYLADTLGELQQFMLAAEFVFIGGSLIKHGGQNILEPARLGKAIVCGPHMYNFEDELNLLLSREACIQVNDIQQLQDAFTSLLSDKEQRETIGQQALSALHQQGDILNQYIRLLFDHPNA